MQIACFLTHGSFPEQCCFCDLFGAHCIYIEVIVFFFFTTQVILVDFGHLCLGAPGQPTYPTAGSAAWETLAKRPAPGTLLRVQVPSCTA